MCEIHEKRGVVPIFGVESFYPGVRANYEAFREAVKAAFREGLIDGLESGGPARTA